MIDIGLIVWGIFVTILALIGALKDGNPSSSFDHYHDSFHMKMLLHSELQNIFEEKPELVKPFIDAINQWQIQGNKEKL